MGWQQKVDKCHDRLVVREGGTGGPMIRWPDRGLGGAYTCAWNDPIGKLGTSALGLVMGTKSIFGQQSSRLVKQAITSVTWTHFMMDKVSSVGSSMQTKITIL